MFLNRVIILIIGVTLCVLLLTTHLPTVNAEQDEKCNCGSKSRAGVKAAIGGLVGALGISGLGTSTVGFTTAGIHAGSLAALVQSTFGISAPLSFLQSLGAKGLLAATGPYGLAAGAVVGLGAYMLSSKSGGTQDCSCDSEPPTEEESAHLVALRKIVACVEPGTSIDSHCGDRGICDFDKDLDDVSCVCHRGFSGTYCEILKNISSDENGENLTPTVPGETRCFDTFIQNCTRCMIASFTPGNNMSMCYKKCNWKNHKSLVKQNINDDDESAGVQRGRVRPDVGSLDMRRVPKLGVIEGTECIVQVNTSCTAITKYVYEHSDGFLDQLVVYYSTDEAYCESENIIDFDRTHVVLGTFLGILIGSYVLTALKSNYGTKIRARKD